MTFYLKKKKKYPNAKQYRIILFHLFLSSAFVENQSEKHIKQQILLKIESIIYGSKQRKWQSHRDDSYDNYVSKYQKNILTTIAKNETIELIHTKFLWIRS